MQFGLCTNMHGTLEDPQGINQLEAVVQAGFDYVELPLAQIMETSESEFKALRERLAALDLCCLRNNNFFPAAMRLTGPNVDTDGIIAYIDRAFLRLHALNSRIVVFGSGPAKNVPDGFPLREGYRQVVELLQQAGAAAEKQDICIAVEPLNKTECNLINTFKEGCELCADVSHERVLALVDYYHLVRESEPLAHIYAYDMKQLLVHVHFAEPGQRRYPQAQEEKAYRNFFRALKAAGYDNTISIEAYDPQPSVNMASALLLLRKIWEQA